MGTMQLIELRHIFILTCQIHNGSGENAKRLNIERRLAQMLILISILCEFSRTRIAICVLQTCDAASITYPSCCTSKW
jgi:hypothetical protein